MFWSPRSWVTLTPSSLYIESRSASCYGSMAVMNGTLYACDIRTSQIHGSPHFGVGGTGGFVLKKC